MKSGKPRKAPKVPNSKPKDNYMKEYDKSVTRKNPMAPMTKKKLSK
jgi:hypothetical protein